MGMRRLGRDYRRAGRPRRLGACNRCPIGTRRIPMVSVLETKSHPWLPTTFRDPPEWHSPVCNSPCRHLARWRLKPAHTHEHVDDARKHSRQRASRRGTPASNRFRPHRFQCAPSLSRQLEDRDRRPVKLASRTRNGPCEIGLRHVAEDPTTAGLWPDRTASNLVKLGRYTLARFRCDDKYDAASASMR